MEDLELGFSVGRSAAAPMARPHRHPEIEVNFIQHGGAQVRIAECVYDLPVGQLFLQWAAIPHQCLATQPNTISWVVNVPLGLFLNWSLPTPLVQPLMLGHVVVDPDPSELTMEVAAYTRWQADVRRGGAYRHACELEVQARLHRLAGSLTTHAAPPFSAGANAGVIGRLLLAIAQRHTEKIGVNELAHDAGLNPRYATTVCRQHLGMPLHALLTRERLATAKRLLALGEKRVLDIALASGFSSPSAFYAAFTKAFGHRPRTLESETRGATTAKISASPANHNRRNGRSDQ